MTAVTYVSLTSLIDDRTLCLPAPSQTVWNRGIESDLRRLMGNAGELNLDEEIVTAQVPAVRLTYSEYTKEITIIKLGLKLAAGATERAIWSQSFRILKASYPPAKPGAEGKGMTADQTDTTVTVLKNGISTALTRQPFATFAAATPNSFAQGVDGELKFSDDLVTGANSKPIATLYATYPAANANIVTDEPFNLFKAAIVGILPDKEVFCMEFPELQIAKAENNEIDFAGQPTLAFFVKNPGCKPNLKFPGAKRTC